MIKFDYCNECFFILVNIFNFYLECKWEIENLYVYV